MTTRAWLYGVVGAVAIALGALAAFAVLRPPPVSFEATDVTGVDWGKRFELTDHRGTRRSAADFRGKVVMLFFGYTRCPDMCPTTLALMSAAVRLLGTDAQKVQGLFVTVDPKRDTPAVLSQYVPAFHPDFLGLYADEETTRRTAREFKVFFEPHEPNRHGSYTVDHSTQIFVLDASGRLRFFIRPEASPESVARDLRLLISGRA